ncbi:acid-sensing ion channel 1-like isoform X2 [Pecten maximus]|uniref:acid-sensing ion channel 1-like isoform X2 n=1 Tax=Pecten maximus TaxID=6579 RepID=UPI0014583C92|nr:acid-sensing ion channel 1-like isoform X2 [Pecten maximus]
MEPSDDPHTKEKVVVGHQTDLVVEDFLSSATIHGLHKAAANGSLIRRCVWIFLLLGMLTSLCIFTYLELSEYFRYETRTNTHVSVRGEIEFPAVTLCNANQVKNTIVNCADLEYLMFRLSELSNTVNLSITRHTNASSISGDEILGCVRAHSHDLEMFRLCFWEGRQVDCSSIFEASLTSMGMCFTFIGALPQRKSRMPGSFGGLRVVIDIEQDQYFFPNKLQSGITVVLHEPEETPLPQMRSFLVGPGLSAEAVLSRNKRSLLPSPYDNCVERESDVARLHRFPKYSSMACLTECFQSSLVSRCSCRHYYDDNFTQLLTTVRRCRTCPEICTTYTYDWSLSYALFGSNFVNERLLNASIFPEKSFLSSNYVDLTLFYNSLSEIVVEDLPVKMLNDIVGNLGGHMGLFLGASILSIAELFEFACLLIAKQRSEHRMDKVNIKESVSTKSSTVQGTDNVLHIENV